MHDWKNSVMLPLSLAQSRRSLLLAGTTLATSLLGAEPHPAVQVRRLIDANQASFQ